MSFSLPPLEYSYDALEPIIDRQTMQIHHTKHHQTYIDKLNAGLSSYPHYESQSVSELLRMIDSLPADLHPIVRNHAGGHANHSLFWKTLRVPQDHNLPTGTLAEAITTAFGSFAEFQNQFTNKAIGQFGSGRAWLVLDPKKELSIITTSNQDSPIMSGYTPLLGLDVWEHAYYLNYQNRRNDYITGRRQIVNWDKVDELYRQGLAPQL